MNRSHRPVPQRISSKTGFTPCRAHVARIAAKSSAGGTTAPGDSPPIGSTMKASTVSGPSSTNAASSASAQVAA
jgi:hypothetical protein